MFANFDSMQIIAVTRMAEISTHYRETATPTRGFVGLVLLAIVVIGAVAFAFRYYQKSKAASECPKSLMRELCRAHGLKGAGAKMLLT